MTYCIWNLNVMGLKVDMLKVGIEQGWKMATKKTRFFKNLKTSKVQNLGFLGFYFLVKFYTDDI